MSTPSLARSYAGSSPAVEALRTHWPEYLCEGVGLGLFMVSACIVAVLLEHPMSGLSIAFETAQGKQFAAGLAMAGTALAIITSPLGQRSGAHLNPALTLSFLALGKVRPWDAVFYVIAQFAGAVTGVGVAWLIIGDPLAHGAVRYAATTPGARGAGIAFAAEFLISALLMLVVLGVSNSARWSRFTPFVAAALIALYITFEAPLSGMSMNPARTVGSAFFAHVWTAVWIYFLAPALGMLSAARMYRALSGLSSVYCAKLHHRNRRRCIFVCNYSALNADRTSIE